MELSALSALVMDDFTATDRIIEQSLKSRIPLITQIGAHITGGGGKRIRALLTLISAKACGYLGDKHQLLSAIIEIIHTATLLHDDVVDDSKLRRNKPTANILYGNAVSVLSGDFLYSKAFELMVKIDNNAILNILARCSNTIAEGEVMQLLNCHRTDITEDEYMAVIQHKTAALFVAACEAPAVLAGQSAEAQAALAAYGMHLGTAFQLTDDIMDYVSDSRTMGKNQGDDLLEGKTTLPLLYGMKLANKADSDFLKTAIAKGDLSALSRIQQIIRDSGALEKTQGMVVQQIRAAKHNLAILINSPYKDALSALADLSALRKD